MRNACHVAAVAGLLAAFGVAKAETQLERGEYLVRVVAACGNCHTPIGPAGFDPTMELGGRLVEKTEAYTAYAQNISPDKETGIGDWSDAELRKAIREGLRPDGTLIGPPMPFHFYRQLSDADLDAIIAYLRTIRPVRSEVPRSTYSFPLPPSYGPPVEHVADVPRGVTVEYGQYLAGPVAHCLECHTTFGPEGPLFDTGFGAGGYEFHGPWGMSVAPNLTSHPEDGLPDWSDEDIAAMVRTGKRPDGSAMAPPMPYPFYADMKDDDIKAIVMYLRTLPPLPDPS